MFIVYMFICILYKGYWRKEWDMNFFYRTFKRSILCKYEQYYINEWYVHKRKGNTLYNLKQVVLLG